MQNETTASVQEPASHVYEAPRVERVMTREELAREIHHAGAGGSGSPG
jgi:hypothetical protein